VPRVVVLSKSRYGSSEKHATWIAEELEADLFAADSFDGKKFHSYKCVVFGGSLYASELIGINVTNENFETLRNKKVVLISVGTSPARPEVLEEIKLKNLTPEMICHAEFHHLRGALTSIN
jgi:menaquinone-dependent protoporphyrinogen IX oxidase